MNAVVNPLDAATLSPGIRAAYEKACGLVAPTWPLDQLIAVNPFWELREHKAADVAARISALVHGHMLMPPTYYAELEDSRISDRHLDAAAKELGVERRPAATLEQDADAPDNWHNVSDLLDSRRDRLHEVAWRDEIIHQISQFCAAALKGASETGSREPGSLYSAWLDSVRHDIGIPILMGERKLGRQFDDLPEDPDTLIAEATQEFGMQAPAAELYAHALLLDVNGWASWIAYRRWQARLQDRHEDLSWDLLAIRMGWELVLWRHVAATDASNAKRLQLLWQRQLTSPDLMLSEHAETQQQAWLWQRAEELAWQEHLAGLFREAAATPSAPPAAPKFQAVFCIDVRSEVYRRHLEACDPGIKTRGFAGFFGLPLEYRPAGTPLTRPQLPGLLAPAIQVSEDSDTALPESLERRARWRDLGDAPPAMFGLVEASGPWYAAKLVRNSFFPSARKHPVNSLRPGSTLKLTRDGAALELDERVELAAGVLHAMGLEDDFAPVVMLVGHGSTSKNNPHAAGLDCGACGGQTGELNSRALADLLNDPDVRDGLLAGGLEIPTATRFVAALHDTTTDEITTFCDSTVPDDIRAWLDAASDATRKERAGKLNLSSQGDTAGALARRARDWSQVRPEWGLANNAAFIAAPRERTAGLDLEGRSFLHDYDWRADTDRSVLELIMTAPMVVANWINMQYNASVTDNVRYGSGNKVLHNVVGGNMGVFEGNGGDLRIGLPLQSLHDGEQWMHTPLRLSVYIAAPADAIQAIYAKHDVVRQLVDNDWLFLFRLDDDGRVARLYEDGWHASPTEAS